MPGSLARKASNKNKPSFRHLISAKWIPFANLFSIHASVVTPMSNARIPNRVILMALVDSDTEVNGDVDNEEVQQQPVKRDPSRENILVSLLQQTGSECTRF